MFIILLFVSFSSFSQTYNEIMSIKDADSFKKVVIENNYESITEEKLRDWFGDDNEEVDSLVLMLEKGVLYSYNNFTHYAGWYEEEKSFKFMFTRRNILGEVDNPYDNLLEKVKKNCKYYKIMTSESGEDYVSYSCSESLYKGKLGFMISDDMGIVVSGVEE